MKRRDFVRVSTAVAITVTFPLMNCSSKLNYNELLAFPITLSHINSSNTLHELGNYYRKLIPKEDSRKILIAFLSINKYGENIPLSSGRMFIQNSLEQKINQDFLENNIIIIDGWILSKTEARQCALYSLIVD